MLMYSNIWSRIGLDLSMNTLSSSSNSFVSSTLVGNILIGNSFFSELIALPISLKYDTLMLEKSSIISG